MAVYMKDSPHHLKLAVESLISQTLLPEEIIVVADGPLTKELEMVLSGYEKANQITVIRLAKNMGPAHAWNAGVEKAATPWIARMDADDISLSDRFEKQLRFLEEHPGIELFGGNIEEFEEDPSMPIRKRNIPLEEGEIYAYARRKNPFNHVTVMFLKESYEKAGRYVQVTGFVDYYLWIRMLRNEAKVANMGETLVKVRVGNDMVGRRRGLQYARSEMRFMWMGYRIGFFAFSRLITNLMIRIPVRLLPPGVVHWIYKYR